MGKTYIFGHKKPDTDAVTSAIALSYLRNKLGDNTTPRVLGTINKETKYALNFFDVKEPKYLNDVKLQIKDVNYHRDFMLKETDSIYNGYSLMIKEGQTGLPITSEDNTFVGLITIKDLSKCLISDTNDMLHTSYDNLLDVLQAKEILRFDEDIQGEILVAAYRSTTFMEKVPLDQSKILIVGDRHSVIEYAAENSVKLMIIAGDGIIKDKHIEMARKNKVNIIKSSLDTYHLCRLVLLSNYIKTMIRSYNPTKFEHTDYVGDVLEINNRLKHTNYPVVDKNNKCLGLLRITDLNEKNPKKVILVDHNEKLQSVDGLEEAEIVEIVDHHNLGSITTNTPINFRNMAVGSTNTIVHKLYKEKGIAIPEHIAGMMISGILSDTLILKSPTTTERDREAVEELSHILRIDYEEYGLNLLKAGTSLEGMNKEDVLYNDFKLYTVEDKTFAIGQFFTMNFDEIRSEIAEYIKVINSVAESNNYKLVALYVTDIIKKGSYVIYNTKSEDMMKVLYNDLDIKEGFFVEGCVSRKKHVVPIVMDLFE